MTSTSAWVERQALLDRHLRYLHARPQLQIAVDTETSDRVKYGPFGLRCDDGRGKCIGVSVAYRDDERRIQSFYVAVDHWVGENDEEIAVKRLGSVLRSGRTLIWANAQFDWFSLRTIGIEVSAQPFRDVITIANMVNENWPIEKSLDNLMEHYLSGQRKIATWPWEAQFKLAQEKKTGWPNTTPEMMDDYARTDTIGTLLVDEVLVKDNRWREIPDEVWEHKQKFIRLLYKMRGRGIRVDKALTSHLERKGSKTMADTNAALGCNLNSQKDKAELFLEKLGLPVLKRGKPTKAEPEGTPSFDKYVMEEYAPILERMNNPIAKVFKAYQGWKTATTAMYRVWLEKCSPDGRLRTEFLTHSTVTGRLSSKNPNLQQIPRETDKEWNGHAKECFIAEHGWGLVNADFSQLELRLGAAYVLKGVGDEVPAWLQGLLDVFADPDRDIFTEMTEQFKRHLPPEIAKWWNRSNQKTLVYSMQYGAGQRRLRNAFGVDDATAALLLDTYRTAFPGFSQLSRAMAMKAEVDGQLKTWSGRVRHFQYDSESYKAMNSVIQGGAADIVERVMVRLFEELDDDDKCRILLTVHDSVVFEIREDLIDEYIPRIREIMSDVDAITAPGSFGVVFAVDVERWKYEYERAA